METVMKLYEFGPTRSIRARWVLQELGVEFEVVTINMLKGENRSPEFLAVNPAGKLPVLVDGDLILTESVAIVLYLAEKYPDKQLIPADIGRTCSTKSVVAVYYNRTRAAFVANGATYTPISEREAHP